MHRRFYTVTRDLHLYLGLFISPFVLVFSVTVFFFVHAIAPKFGAETTQTRAATAVSLPPDLSNFEQHLSLAQTAAKTPARRPLSCLGLAPLRPLLLWPSVDVQRSD